MKLSPRAYAILWDGHAWAGAVSSVILFAIFFLGPFALFAEQLGPWQEPAFREAPAVSQDDAIALAQRIVDEEAAQKPVWFGVSLPADEEPWLRLWHFDEGAFHYTWLHPVTGARIGERSDLGEFLNAMHFLEPLPYGTAIAGIASIVLLFLAGTGLALQLGRFLREALQFRPGGKARRTQWSDAHKVVGSVTLPFVIVFALTGAILCLADLLQPTVTQALFDGDAAAHSRATEWPNPPTASGKPAKAPDLAAAFRIATARYPDAEHRWFFIDNLGDENVSMDLPGEQDGTLGRYTNVRFAGDGSVTWTRDAGGSNPYASAMALLFSMHFAGWAGYGGKMLFAALSLLTAFGILAGNLLWLERRRAKGFARFDALLERLTAGGCAAMPAAVAAVFLANQLLPLDLDRRAELEHAAFFAAALAVIAWALVARAPARAAAHALLGSAAILFAVPFIDAVRFGRLPLDPRTGWLYGTEVGLVALALVLAGAAFATGRIARRSSASIARPLAAPPEPETIAPPRAA